MAPINNSTLPPGWSNHGEEGLICQPADWLSIIGFYVSNYIAHLFSLRTFPAETLYEHTSAQLYILLYAGSGLMRAMEQIKYNTYLYFKNNRRTSHELKRAQSAGALCMVVRSMDWVPSPLDLGCTIKHIRLREDLLNQCQSGISISGMPCKNTTYSVCAPPWYKSLRSRVLYERTIKERGCKIHGCHKLPPGYEFGYVPSEAILQPPSVGTADGSDVITHITAGGSCANVLVSIYQLDASSVSLCRARGGQLKEYGYSLFGLTVIPYLLMTAINLIAQMFSNDYAALYMVESAEMVEAIRRGGYFKGTVGVIRNIESHNGELPEELRRAQVTVARRRRVQRARKASTDVKGRRRPNNDTVPLSDRHHSTPSQNRASQRASQFISSDLSSWMIDSASSCMTLRNVDADVQLAVTKCKLILAAQRWANKSPRRLLAELRVDSECLPFGWSYDLSRSGTVAWLGSISPVGKKAPVLVSCCTAFARTDELVDNEADAVQRTDLFFYMAIAVVLAAMSSDSTELSASIIQESTQHLSREVL